MSNSSEGNKPSAKNPCPICSRPKTAWSIRCQRCEGNRQRYITSLARQAEDVEFLAHLEGKTLQQVADERGVKRQRVHQLKKDAERRVAFLHQHKPPRLAFEQTPA